MTFCDWEKKFYSYYTKHSLPIKCLPQVELLLRDYTKSDPKGLRRLVTFLDKIERRYKAGKWEGEVEASRGVSSIALGYLLLYCATFPEELPCMLADFLTDNEVGKTLEASKFINENWDERREIWDWEGKYTLYALISPDEKDAAFLEEKLQITDKNLFRFILREKKRVKKSLKRWEKPLK